MGGNYNIYIPTPLSYHCWFACQSISWMSNHYGEFSFKFLKFMLSHEGILKTIRQILHPIKDCSALLHANKPGAGFLLR